MGKNYVLVSRSRLMKKEAETTRVERYLKEKQWLKKNPSKAEFETLNFCLFSGEVTYPAPPHKATILEFGVGDYTTKKDKRFQLLSDKQKKRLLGTVLYGDFNNSLYAVSCRHRSDNKGIQINIDFAFTGFELVKNSIYFNDIIRYMLLFHSTKTGIDPLPLHSIVLSGVTSSETIKLTENVMDSMINRRSPYTNMIAYPKITVQEKAQYSKGNKFKVYRHKEALEIFAQNDPGIKKFQLSEYYSDGHMLLRRGWGTPIIRLCEELKISLINAKVSFLCDADKRKDKFGKFTKNNFKRHEFKIKITFNPSTERRIHTRDLYQALKRRCISCGLLLYPFPANCPNYGSHILFGDSYSCPFCNSSLVISPPECPHCHTMQ